MADRYFMNGPLGPGPVTLEGPEAHHLSTVCRARPDSVVCLFNGDGCEYPARIVDVSRRKVTLEISAVERPERELPFRLEVAAPLPKGDRVQFLIEKLTELGVTHFVPIRTSRSATHRSEGRLERLRRYVIEASKQCGRNRLLQVAPAADWQSYCGGYDLPALRILAHPILPRGEEPTPIQLPTGGDRVAALGPEGGLADEEVAAAVRNGWQLVSLGTRILRLETAAIVLAAFAGQGSPLGANSAAGA